MKAFVMKIREVQEEIWQIDSQIAGLNQRKSKLEVILCVLMESTTHDQTLLVLYAILLYFVRFIAG